MAEATRMAVEVVNYEPTDFYYSTAWNRYFVGPNSVPAGGNGWAGVNETIVLKHMFSKFSFRPSYRLSNMEC